MKKHFLHLSFIFFVLMGIQKNSVAQSSNQKAKMIIGVCDRNALKTNEQFSAAYNLHYTDYNPDSSKLDSLKQTLRGLKIHIVFGTWCGDSKLQVPRFLKIMDAVAFPSDSLTYEGVAYEKHTVKNLNIEKVPTFIFTRNGEEIYRLIERPKFSLESDLLTNIH